ncbi:hypothetical protein MKX03_033011 [Papaver bracteatum]|nr:hypothetical protein MKX03_033011 [Papaver bracteatum]
MVTPDYLCRPFNRCPTGSPPYNGTTSTSSRAGSGMNNFDTSMVIILAALLCALICTLGLNSIIRCALRCSRRFRVSTHNNENIVSRLPDIGLKRQVLCQIPVTIYGSSKGGNKNALVAPTDCPICLGEFIEGEKCRILPKCNHGFHVKCIDTWLLSHSSCPTCRHSLLELPTAPPLSEDSGNTPLADRGVTVIIDDVS